MISDKRRVLAAVMVGGVLLGTSGAAVASGPSIMGPGTFNSTPDNKANIIEGELAQSNPGAAVLLWDYTTKEGEAKVHQQCTASVLNANYVLTAAHCVPDNQINKIHRLSVRVNSLQSKSGGQQIRLAGWATQNDVRVLRLAEPIKNPQPVKLAKADPPVQSINTIYGWGADSQDAEAGVPSLKKADVKVSSTTSGKDHFGGPAIMSIGVDGWAWKGDSGGPQFYNGEQVGIASRAAPSQKLNIYASVAKNRDFIDGVVSGRIPSPRPEDAEEPNPAPEQPQPTETAEPKPDPTTTTNPAPVPTTTNPAPRPRPTWTPTWRPAEPWIMGANGLTQGAPRLGQVGLY